MDNILNTLIEARREKGITLKELSEKSGVALGTVNKLFSGAIKSVKVATAQKLADALGIDSVGASQNGEEMKELKKSASDSYGFIRCAAVTNEVKVGDVDFNVNTILELVKSLAKKGVSIAVFPELNITSYTAGDLFYQELLLSKAEEGLIYIAQQSKFYEMLIFVGLPLRVGGRLYNVAAAISKGEILAFIPKKNLPDYNEFNEKRWFCEPSDEVIYIDFHGKKIPFGYKIIFNNVIMPEVKVACEICEDLWVADSPSVNHAFAGATVIANLSASNEVAGKAVYRKNMINMQSSKEIAVYIYTSSGKGESSGDVVFGGHNYISEGGKFAAESKPFADGIAIADVDCRMLESERFRKFKNKREVNDYLFVDYSALNDNRGKLLKFFTKLPFVPQNEDKRVERFNEIFDIQVNGLLTRMKKIGTDKLVLGISGGLDSTLAMLVCAEALKKAGKKADDLVAITMPCFGTSDRTYLNACALANELKCMFLNIDIKDSVLSHLKDIGHSPENHDVAYENAQARERTQVLMDYANMVNGIVVGTGDMSEIALGWSTYNGDQMSMYNVNCGVPKTLMREMVNYFAEEKGCKLGRVLKDVAQTPISPELKPPKEGKITQSTEELVGPYVLNDFFMFHLLRHCFAPSKVFYIACRTFEGEYDEKTIYKWLENFIKRFFNSQFKRSAAPDGVKVGALYLSAKGGFKMPSDATFALWKSDLESIKIL